MNQDEESRRKAAIANALRPVRALLTDEDSEYCRAALSLLTEISSKRRMIKKVQLQARHARMRQDIAGKLEVLRAVLSKVPRQAIARQLCDYLLEDYR